MLYAHRYDSAFRIAKGPYLETHLPKQPGIGGGWHRLSVRPLPLPLGEDFVANQKNQRLLFGLSLICIFRQPYAQHVQPMHVQ